MQETEAFGRGNDGTNFIWKVYSTVGYCNPRPRRNDVEWTWDHLSFAFNFPNGEQTLNIPPQLCTIKEKKATIKRPESRPNRNYRSPSERNASDFLLADLKRKIDRCVKANKERDTDALAGELEAKAKIKN